MSETSETSSVDGVFRHQRYVFGQMRRVFRDFPTLAVVSPTEDGWRVRSTDRSYNHDYVCYETFEEVMDWLDGDLKRPYLCRDREDAQCVLLESERLNTGFISPDGCLSRYDAVERVLRHLEVGW